MVNKIALVSSIVFGSLWDRWGMVCCAQMVGHDKAAGWGYIWVPCIYYRFWDTVCVCVYSVWSVAWMVCVVCVWCVESPCLSFDVINDELGSSREEFPLSCLLVGGTQARRAQANTVIVMKLTNLCKTQKSNNDEDDDDDRCLPTAAFYTYC